MIIKRTLATVALAGAFVLGIVGCGNRYPQYNFNGNIGKERVKFTEKFDFLSTHSENTLEVTKQDGRVIKYFDKYTSDLKIESVSITKDSHTSIYSMGDEVGDAVLRKAQLQFNDYLEQIKKTNLNRGLNSLD